MNEDSGSGSVEEEAAATTSAKEGLVASSSVVGGRIDSGTLGEEEVSLCSLTGEREGAVMSIGFSFSFSGEAAVIGTRDSVDAGSGRGVAVGVVAFWEREVWEGDLEKRRS